MKKVKKKKVCSKCGANLPVKKFQKNARSNDGLQNNCKICQCDYSQDYYVNHSDYCIKRGMLYQQHKQGKLDETNYLSSWNKLREEYGIRYSA